MDKVRRDALEDTMHYCKYAWFQHPRFGTLAIYTAFMTTAHVAAQSELAWRHFDEVNGGRLTPFDTWDM